MSGIFHSTCLCFLSPAPKWITIAFSRVWQAFRDSQAGTAEVKVPEHCHKHDLKFCQCAPSLRLSLFSTLSIALSLCFTFPCLSWAHSLPTPPYFLLPPLSILFLSFSSPVPTKVWESVSAASDASYVTASMSVSFIYNEVFLFSRGCRKFCHTSDNMSLHPVRSEFPQSELVLWSVWNNWTKGPP